METIDLGFKKFEITKQAFIVFVAAIISFIVQLIVLVFFTNDPGVMPFIFFILYVAIMIPLIVYANNCFVTGKCVVLSWVVAMIYLGLSILNVFMLIGLAFFPHKELKSSSKKSSSSSKKSSR